MQTFPLLIFMFKGQNVVKSVCSFVLTCNRASELSSFITAALDFSLKCLH